MLLESRKILSRRSRWELRTPRRSGGPFRTIEIVFGLERMLTLGNFHQRLLEWTRLRSDGGRRDIRFRAPVTALEHAIAGACRCHLALKSRHKVLDGVLPRCARSGM